MMYVAIFQTLLGEFFQMLLNLPYVAFLIWYSPVFILSALSAWLWLKSKYSKNQKWYLVIQEFVFSLIPCFVIYFICMFASGESIYGVLATVLYWFFINIPVTYFIIKNIDYDKDSLFKNTLIGIMYKAFCLIPLVIFFIAANTTSSY